MLSLLVWPKLITLSGFYCIIKSRKNIVLLIHCNHTKRFHGFNQTTDAFPDCPPICPDSYDPVCGTDGKKYENLCKLKLADCDDTETDIQRDPAGTCLEGES